MSSERNTGLFSLVLLLLCAELARTDLVFAEVIILKQGLDVGDTEQRSRGVFSISYCKCYKPNE